MDEKKHVAASFSRRAVETGAARPVSGRDEDLAARVAREHLEAPGGVGAFAVHRNDYGDQRTPPGAADASIRTQ